MIKFISYTGKWPNLCSGVFTVEINGKEYKFGHEIDDYDFKTNSYKTDNFEQFWVSGGCIKKIKTGICVLYRNRGKLMDIGNVQTKNIRSG